MAYKFNTNYGSQTLGGRTGGSGLDAGAKALQKSFDDNLAAEKALRLSDLTNRQELNNTINSYGNASNDKAFNDANTQMLLGMADEYAKVTDALARGTVDVAEGTAYQSQLKSALDMYGKFVVASKSLEDQINTAGGFDRGATGSLILGGGVNDGQTLNMIHRLWNNPNGLEFTRDGNGMYLRDKSSGKVINAEQFVQALENGRSLGETVPDVNETVNTAFKAIDTNPAFGAYKREQQYTSANGTTTTSIKYNKEMLKEAFTKADPWQPLIDNSTQANGTWEYLMHLDGYKDRVMASNNGLWVGNEIDENGDFTDIAQSQQKLMKEMLTELAINKNVPNSDLITTSITKTSPGDGNNKEKTPTTNLQAEAYDTHTRNMFNVDRLFREFGENTNNPGFKKKIMEDMNAILGVVEGDAGSYRFENDEIVNEDGDVLNLGNNINKIVSLLNEMSFLSEVDDKDKKARLDAIRKMQQNYTRDKFNRNKAGDITYKSNPFVSSDSGGNAR